MYFVPATSRQKNGFQNAALVSDARNFAATPDPLISPSKKPGNLSAASKLPPPENDRFDSRDAAKTKPAGKPVISSKPEPVKPKSQDPQAENSESHHHTGNASKWVSAFKLSFSLLLAGGVNAFLFGVPLPVAVGLSTAVSASQSALALKIHREDTDFSRKLVKISRHLVGKDKDTSPSAKEWSMVPIWGGVCGLLVLGEACLNDLYRTCFKKGKSDSLIQRAEKLQIESVNQKHSSIIRWLYSTQHQAVSSFIKLMDRMFAAVDQSALKGFKQFFSGQWNHIKHYQGGQKRLWSYGFAVSAAIFGGLFQTSLAALLQEKMDRRNGLKNNI